MPGITLELAQAQLQKYLDAEAAVLLNQSYEIADRKLTRANLKDIQEGIALWQGRVTDLSVLPGQRRRTIVMRPGG